MIRSPFKSDLQEVSVESAPLGQPPLLRVPRFDTLMRDLWVIIKLHKWSGIAFGAGLFGISLAAALLQSNSYSSHASVFVKLGRESVSLDPTVMTTQAITVNETREVEVNSILEVLTSRSIAEGVVDELGHEIVLSGVLPSSDEGESESFLGRYIGGAIDSLRRFNDGREVGLRERAIKRLTKNLEVTIPKKTTVIQLAYETKTPDAAQAILAKLIDVFQMEHVRINRTQGSHDFLTEQAAVLEKKLLLAQNELLAEKNRLGLVSVEGARARLQEEINLLSQHLINNNAELAASQSKIRDLAKSIAMLPERIETEGVTGLSNEATDRMRDALYQLQISEQDLRAKFTETHPAMVQLRKQVAEAEEIYKKQSEVRETKTTDVHPARQNLELLLLTERATEASLRGRADALQDRMELATTELQELNRNEVGLAQLQREIDLSEHSFRAYSDRLEQSRLDRELQSQRISNVNILQPASYLEKPVGPPRLIILAAGAFFAVAGGLATCVLAESFRPTIKSVQDVEQSLAIPVVMALSNLDYRSMSSHTDLSRQI